MWWVDEPKCRRKSFSVMWSCGLQLSIKESTVLAWPLRAKQASLGPITVL